jgi:hypothetical protein
MVRDNHIEHFKLDGLALSCPETGHGHEPGELGNEAIVEHLTSALDAVYEAAPHVWLEATFTGYCPSPWWLMHVNSVITAYGDDAPHGEVPALPYRESYTSARDFYNLVGSTLVPVPAAAAEVLGIVHQTQEPFINDAVMVLMRGHEFLPTYINPAHMSQYNWQQLARLLDWSRANKGALSHTTPLLPTSWAGGVPGFDAVMPRQPYGYAHVGGQSGLIALRNPFIAPASYTLALDERIGVHPAAAGLRLVSLYPENRCYGGQKK